jgi:hypothetical protein
VFIKDTPGILTDQSISCDGKREGDKWVGVCSEDFTIPWMYQRLPTSCSLTLRFQIGALLTQRIEGRVQSYEYGEPLTIGTCPKAVEKEYQLNLIPK